MKLLNKITLKVSSFNISTLSLYKLFLLKIIKKLNLPYSIGFLPKKIKKITLLKSPHVHKKAREQFQVITYSFTLSLITESNLNILHFLQINKPKTIKTKFQIQKYQAKPNKIIN